MSHRTYFSVLLKKNLWIYFFSFLIAPLTYIGKIVITGSVSNEDYWILAAIISFVLMLWAYNDFWMAESLNFFLPDHLHKKEKKKITQTFSIALVTQILSSTVLAIILFLLSEILAKYYFKTPIAESLLRIFIVYFFLDNIFRSISMFFQAVQDTKLQKSIDFLRNFFQICLIISIAVGGYWIITNFAWAYSISTAWGVIIGLFFIIKKYWNFFTRDGWYFWRADFLKIFQYAIYVMLSANVWVLLSQLDSQMITIMLWTTEVWFYNVYLSIMRIPFLLLLPGVYFLFPVFADLIKKWEKDKIRKIHSFCYEFFAIVALFVTSFYYIFGDELTEVLFGKNYAFSWTILLYSAPFLIFDFLLQIDFQVLSASWKPRTKMFILLSAVCLNLITNYIFIKIWWIAGSALASWIWWIFIWLLTYRETREYAGTFSWKEFLKNWIWIMITTFWLSFIHLDTFLSWRLQLLWWLILIGCIYGIVFMSMNFTKFRNFFILFRHKEISW